jgi:hypothetical protein
MRFRSAEYDEGVVSSEAFLLLILHPIQSIHTTMR